jgi:hypothetical protein
MLLKNESHYTLSNISHIIGPCRQWWDMSETPNISLLNILIIFIIFIISKNRMFKVEKRVLFKRMPLIVFDYLI